MTVGNGVKDESSDVRNLKLGGHVGFDSLPDQLVNKSVQSGFSFNILCIGRMIEQNYYVDLESIGSSLGVQ